MSSTPALSFLMQSNERAALQSSSSSTSVAFPMLPLSSVLSKPMPDSNHSTPRSINNSDRSSSAREQASTPSTPRLRAPPLPNTARAAVPPSYPSASTNNTSSSIRSTLRKSQSATNLREMKDRSNVDSLTQIQQASQSQLHPIAQYQLWLSSVEAQASLQQRASTISGTKGSFNQEANLLNMLNRRVRRLSLPPPPPSSENALRNSLQKQAVPTTRAPFHALPNERPSTHSTSTYSPYTPQPLLPACNPHHRASTSLDSAIFDASDMYQLSMSQQKSTSTLSSSQKPPTHTSMYRNRLSILVNGKLTNTNPSTPLLTRMPDARNRSLSANKQRESGSSNNSGRTSPSLSFSDYHDLFPSSGCPLSETEMRFLASCMPIDQHVSQLSSLFAFIHDDLPRRKWAYVFEHVILFPIISSSVNEFYQELMKNWKAWMLPCLSLKSPGDRLLEYVFFTTNALG